LVVGGFSGYKVALPETRYVSPGQSVAYDDEQVTVNLLRIFGGQPGAEAEVQNAETTTRGVELQVTVVRNAPTVPDGVEGPTIPSVRDLQKSAQANMRDVATLRAVLEDIRRQYTLVDRGVPFGITPVVTIGPQGGVVAASGTIAIGQIGI
jgi:hypothetical protein